LLFKNQRSQLKEYIYDFNIQKYKKTVIIQILLNMRYH
jgi:hypothetical protein